MAQRCPASINTARLISAGIAGLLISLSWLITANSTTNDIYPYAPISLRGTCKPSSLSLLSKSYLPYKVARLEISVNCRILPKICVRLSTIITQWLFHIFHRVVSYSAAKSRSFATVVVYLRFSPCNYGESSSKYCISNASSVFMTCSILLPARQRRWSNFCRISRYSVITAWARNELLWMPSFFFFVSSWNSRWKSCHLKGSPQLVARLMYGSGLRINEALRLRVKDVDFGMQQIIVRSPVDDGF